MLCSPCSWFINDTIFTNPAGSIILKNKDAYDATTIIDIADEDVVSFLVKRGNLIRQDDQAINYYTCTNGQVEYEPTQKYRLEKKNAYDPTYLHRREAYREDSFDLEGVLTAQEYYDLMEFLLAPGRLYLEYTAYNSTNSQFPVTVGQLPKCPDDLHEYPVKVKFSLESRYIGTPGYIDFGIIIITDFDETVIGQT